MLLKAASLIFIFSLLLSCRSIAQKDSVSKYKGLSLVVSMNPGYAGFNFTSSGSYRGYAKYPFPDYGNYIYNRSLVAPVLLHPEFGLEYTFRTGFKLAFSLDYQRIAFSLPNIVFPVYHVNKYYSPNGHLDSTRSQLISSNNYNEEFQLRTFGYTLGIGYNFKLKNAWRLEVQTALKLNNMSHLEVIRRNIPKDETTRTVVFSDPGIGFGGVNKVKVTYTFGGVTLFSGFGFSWCNNPTHGFYIEISSSTSFYYTLSSFRNYYLLAGISLSL